MKRNLSGFISMLLCLVLVWTLIPAPAFAGEDEELTVSWGDQLDGYFMAASDEADFGDVYRSCPFVTRKFAFYWSQDGDPEHRDSDVNVTAYAAEDSCFWMKTEGNILKITPGIELLPDSDGAYSETVVVVLCLGDPETAERRQEIELTLSMNVKTGEPLFTINSAGDLMAFAALVNSGYTDVNAVLGSDISLDEEAWIPIGCTKDTAFEGEFDGAGYTISGLYMDTDDALGGLFGVLKGSVKNLRIEDSRIRSAEHAGAVAAWNLGTIENVSADAIVSADTPSVFPVDVRKLQYKRLVRPIYPLEEDIILQEVWKNEDNES